MSQKSKLSFISAFTLVHVLVTVLLFFWSFSVVMSNADDGKPLPAYGEILVRVSDIFQYPVLIPLGRIEYLRDVLPVWAGWIILLINSLVWALLALGILIGLQRLRKRQG